MTPTEAAMSEDSELVAPLDEWEGTASRCQFCGRFVTDDECTCSEEPR